MEPSADTSLSDLPFVTLGTARLPKTVAGEQPGVLMVELALDSQDGRIVDVAATVTLPSYGSLLRRLLINRPLGEVECAAKELCAQLHGPLLKPTVAALASAVSNATNRVAAAEAGGNNHASLPN